MMAEWSEVLAIRYNDYLSLSRWMAREGDDIPKDFAMEVLKGFLSGETLKDAVLRFATMSEENTEFVFDTFSGYSLLDLRCGEGSEKTVSVEVLKAAGPQKDIPPDKTVSKTTLPAKSSETEKLEVAKNITSCILSRYGVGKNEIKISSIIHSGAASKPDEAARRPIRPKAVSAQV